MQGMLTGRFDAVADKFCICKSTFGRLLKIIYVIKLRSRVTNEILHSHIVRIAAISKIYYILESFEFTLKS